MKTNKLEIIKHFKAGRGTYSPAFLFVSFLASAIMLCALLINPLEASAEQDTKQKADALLKEASTLLDDGELDKALSTVNEAVKIHPDYPDAYEQLGFVLLKKGQLDDAINAFNTTLKINPRAHTSKTGIGLALLKKDDTSGAEAILKEALTFNPYPSTAHYALGLVYEKLNDFENSTYHFKEGIKTFKSGKK